MAQGFVQLESPVQMHAFEVLVLSVVRYNYAQSRSISAKYFRPDRVKSWRCQKEIFLGLIQNANKLLMANIMY